MPILFIDRIGRTHYRWGLRNYAIKSMEKTPEEMRTEAKALLAAADAKEAISQGKQAIPTTIQGQSPTPLPDPKTGYFPKKPKRPGFTPTQICSQATQAEAEAGFKKLSEERPE